MIDVLWILGRGVYRFAASKVGRRVLMTMGVLAAVVWTGAQIAEARARTQIALLRADSIEAALDTTRVLYADSLTVYRLRVVQGELSRDRLQRFLDDEIASRTTATMTLDSVRTELDAVASEDSLGTRTVEWAGKSEGVAIQATATVVPPPDTSHLSAAVQIDPIPITVRLSCLPGEVNAAEAQIWSTFPWVSFDITSAEMGADVCNPPVPMTLPDLSILASSDFRKGLAVGAAGGVILSLLYILR